MNSDSRLKSSAEFDTIPSKLGLRTIRKSFSKPTSLVVLLSKEPGGWQRREPAGVKYLRQGRRHEKQGTAQRGLKGTPPKGGLRLGARPGGKDLLGKNHEAASISWTGRANRPDPPWKGFSPGRGDRPVARSPAPFCGTRPMTARKGPARPMLFAQKVLAPGPQPSIPELSSSIGPPAVPGVYQNEIRRLMLYGKERVRKNGRTGLY